MRIVFVTETWLPSTNGIVTRLSATLGRLVDAGHEILVIAPRAADRPGGDVSFPGVTVRTVHAVGLWFVYGGQRWGLPLPAVGRFISRFDPDVVHVVNPAWLGIAAVRAARRQRRPLVASYHTDLAAHAVHYHLGWLVPVIWRLLRSLHAQAAVNLVTSESAARNLTLHGIPRIRLWPRGVDSTVFRPADPQSATNRSKRPVALYVGRLAAEKGLDRLAWLADPDSGVDLVLVGDGPQRRELRQRFCSETVRFTGTLHGASLAAEYQHADVFVFPSTTETLGLVLLEALACGLPIIAADSPASREFMTECSNGSLFHPDQPEELLTLTLDACRRPPDELLVGTARQRATAWGWDRATERLLDFYREAMERSTASGNGLRDTKLPGSPPPHQPELEEDASAA